jgi:hypothetical protein
MPANFGRVFAVLKPVLSQHAQRLSVKADTPLEYTLETKSRSPFPQHKGHPMFFGSVRVGKAYVSFHLMPLYMNSTLTKKISPDLKKKMQGKSCFNFKSDPEPAIVVELRQLTDAALTEWAKQRWL